MRTKLFFSMIVIFLLLYRWGAPLPAPGKSGRSRQKQPLARVSCFRAS